MKYSRSLRLAAICGSALFGACADDGPAGPNVTITAAPLDYPGVADVCYGLTVYNGVPEADGTDTVWSKDDICSSTHGNLGGGDISYVGPCDASVDGDNYIALTLEKIQVVGGQNLDDQVSAALLGGDADFQNPCTADHRCFLHFECKENEDVAVEFNITVMRDANQGFFDIAVNFEDIFCSAKVDSCSSGGTPIRQLFGDDFHDAVGRDLTTVAAVACTAGPDVPFHDFDTSLLFTSKTVACDGNVNFTLNPVGADGGDLTATSDNGGYTLRYAHYYGAEQLRCGVMQETADNGDLYFTCPTGTCHISGFSPPPGYGGLGGVGLNAQQGSQGSYGAGAAAGAGGYGGGYGGYGGYGGGYGGGFGNNGGYGYFAAQAGVTLHYFEGDTEIFPELDGNDEPILPDWEANYVPLSCNKTYYNTAIDVENLVGQGLSGCTLSFHATAIASDDTTSGFTSGSFSKQGSLYGAINVEDVQLIEANGQGGFRPTCNANPLDGVDLNGNPSQVKTQFIGTLGDANPLFCFHSDNGTALYNFLGCGTVPPQECPYNCPECAPWTGVTLSCVSGGLGGSGAGAGIGIGLGSVICSGTGAQPNTQLTLFALGGYGDPMIGHFNSNPDGTFTSPPFTGNVAATFVVSQNGATLVSTGLMCTSCEAPYVINELGFCGQPYVPPCQLDNCNSCPSGTTCDDCDPGYIADENGQCVVDPPCDVAANCQECGDWNGATLDCVADNEGTVTCDLKGGPSSTDIVLLSPNGYYVQYVTTEPDGSGTYIVPANEFADGLFFFIKDYNTGIVLVTTSPLRCEMCVPGYSVNEVGECYVPSGGGA